MTARPTTARIQDWLDGRLSPAECDAFEAALEADPDFAEEVLRQQDALPRYVACIGDLQAAFPVEDAAPPELVTRLGLGAAPAPASLPAERNPEPNNVISLPSSRAKRHTRSTWNWVAGGALAAGLALAVMLAPQLHQSDHGAETPGSLELALSRTPSAAKARLADGTTLRPELSFAAADGRWCREFVITDAAGTGYGPRSGIACKGGRGWSIEAMAKTGDQRDGSAGIRTAAGADTAPLDAAYARLGGSDPIAMDRETDLIAKSWPPPSR